MLGIGHRLQKQTKKKILLQKAKQYNEKYDQLVSDGHQKEAAEIIKQQQYERRHEVPPNLQPYKTQDKMNQLGGAINLGYKQTTKTLTQTQTMYKPMEEHMTKTKAGLKFDGDKAQIQKEQHERMKKRIYKDHLAQDKQIDLNEPKKTDYTRNYVNDDKLKQEVRNKDKQHYQKMNDLKEYAESYIKSKASLRKC